MKFIRWEKMKWDKVKYLGISLMARRDPDKKLYSWILYMDGNKRKMNWYL